jgi:hypothetical protein
LILCIYLFLSVGFVLIYVNFYRTRLMFKESGKAFKDLNGKDDNKEIQITISAPYRSFRYELQSNSIFFFSSFLFLFSLFFMFIRSIYVSRLASTTRM